MFAAISVLSGAAAFLAVPGEQLLLLPGVALLGALCVWPGVVLDVTMFLGGVDLGEEELSERDDDSHVGEGGNVGCVGPSFLPG